MYNVELSHIQDMLLPVPMDFSNFLNWIEMIIMFNNCFILYKKNLKLLRPYLCL